MLGVAPRGVPAGASESVCHANIVTLHGITCPPEVSAVIAEFEGDQKIAFHLV